ncbi:hypothetical protein [Sphingopyxis fribergensis]|uniref:hypothetical protein n=1 Tax=Sphingopyxis fribergensis TaxID=1515612 RepID=UPI0011DD445C|nr:hypothetical protein [Sphingopyxis fribergensis]
MRKKMIVVQLDAPGEPLRRVERPIPEPAPGEIRLAVTACCVYRTDLDIADWRRRMRRSTSCVRAVEGALVLVPPSPRANASEFSDTS